jgi:hypothetical protein
VVAGAAVLTTLGAADVPVVLGVAILNMRRDLLELALA